MSRHTYLRALSLTLVTAACIASALNAQTVATTHRDPTASEIKQAENAYLAGVKRMTSADYAGAQKNFAHALELYPGKLDYTVALAMARERQVAALAQQAGRERSLGHDATADDLLHAAARIDPANPIVAEHLAPQSFVEPLARPIGGDEIANLGNVPHLTPTSGTHSIHFRGDSQSVLRDVYRTWGIKTSFDPSVTSKQLRLDLEDADFTTATRSALQMAHAFAATITTDSVIIALESQENRDRLVPLVEETMYIPSYSQEQLTELSNVAKSVFDLKQVSISASTGTLLLRGPEDALDLVNATFANLIDVGAEVQLDVSVYEVDRTKSRDIGAILPSSAGVFSVTSELQNIVSTNQAAVNQLIASGAIKLTGNYFTDLGLEAFGLLAAGIATPAELANALFYFGSFGKFTFNGKTYNIPLGGVFLGSATSFNFAMNSSDTRSLDFMQLRVSDGKIGTLRVGSRYPITTSTYSSGISSALATQLQGVTINGQSAASLLGQYQNSAVTVPQIQYEDLGLTLKATPQVLRSGDVALHLDLKIESLGGGLIDNIPILNSRQLTQDITIPAGQLAMLASAVSITEIGAIDGVPGLSDIPGFTGTEKSKERDTQEVLITITPHVIRGRSPVIGARRLAANLAPTQ